MQPIVFNTRQTSLYLTKEANHDHKIIVLVRSPRVLIEVAQNGFHPRNVNLGGMHYMDKRREYLPYVFLSDEDIKDIKTLLRMGVNIYCQDIPTSKKYNIVDILQN
jgi:mannose/fructose/N-acetylgalactosamine-specific phosphotransferase system component IIB